MSNPSLLQKMAFGFNRVTPNRIDTVNVPGYVGSMGLVSCPGVRVNISKGTKRNLLADLKEIDDWGANRVVCFLEPHEFQLLKVEELPASVRERNMKWMHLPIMDMQIPSQAFEDAWAVEGERIRHAIRIGERVIMHCYAGLGRTGMIAARILVEMGMDPEEAILTVRDDNRRRIQTKDQAAFVRTCYPLY